MTATIEGYAAPVAPLTYPATGMFAAPHDEAPLSDDPEDLSPPETEQPKSYGLRPYQRGIIHGDENFPGVLKELKDKRATLVVAATGTGKCLGKGTPVLMFDGTIKAVQHVVAGDLLMGPDSKPRNVISTTRGVGPLYYVQPTKGDGYVVNDAHILSLKCTSSRGPASPYKKGAVTNIGVTDYLNESNTFRHMMKGWRTGVEWEYRPVGLHPYFLGLWLGDGASRHQGITTIDHEVVSFLADYAQSMGLELVCRIDKHDVPTYFAVDRTAIGCKAKHPVLGALRAYNLLQNKHVPSHFRANSRSIRLQVLAGIIDSDGSLTCNGYDVVFINERLANDTAFLARSLGLACYKRGCYKTCTNTGAEGHYYRLSISGDTHEIPVKISRKKATPRRQKKNVLLSGLDIQPIGDGEYFGFEIDGDRLFMLGDFTVTHNTVCFGELTRLASKWNHGTLLLVHRDELIRQIVRTCGRYGIHTLIEKAGERALPSFSSRDSNTVVASVQSMRGDRLTAWPQDAFRLIVIDEAHHATAAGYRAIVDHFKTAKIVGFTATADRLDGDNLGVVFQSLAYEYNLRTAISEGWLVPIEAMPLTTDPKINLKDLRIVAGDFNSGDLEKAINENIGTLVNAVVQTNALEDRRTIAFTPNVSSAEALSHALNDVGITSKWVSGNSPDRAEVFKAHQSGECQVLVNCMIATEGYDDPEVSAILICRPTKSRALFAQMCGRGTRLHRQSGKTNCRIVDFAYLTGKHRLVGPVDLYDNSETPDEVVEEARKIVEKGEESNPETALELATERIEEANRVRIQQRHVSVRASKFDPVAACELFGISQHKDAYGWADTDPATAKQLNALKKWGVQANADTPKHVASALLKKIFGRNEKGWASPYQVQKLIESGKSVNEALGTRSEAAQQYLAENPLGASSKQAWKLRQLGESQGAIERMTRKEASARIGELMAA